MGKNYPNVNEDYQNAVEKAKKKLRVLIAEKNCAQIMLHLVWTMRYPAELARGGANNGLDIAIKLLEPIKEQFPILSFVDFYKLAGVVAVEVTGGPEIPLHPGREDTPEPPIEGRLPDASKGLDRNGSYYCLKEYVDMGVLDV
ncbi:hypothetical protein SAY87_001907 [Trapa incisa]|uniref:Plant heme peroxidase family profile domain-containing protein n=1 Tax=Trapa incisa TaxID=236973 RepID=A0AAN7JYU5_9MYRT|nr:hypothetical protein SAY87_001907 [Trapa incisa]